MKTIVITKNDLDKDNFYKKEEIGKCDEYANVSVEIEEYLGHVKFKNGVYVNGYILAKAGSGIKAGEGIEAGYGIEAGEGIKAGYGIEAGEGIKAGYGIEAGEGIEAGYGIEAGEGIKAGWGIEAGEGIKAGYGIEAGEGIEAGSGIKAGEGIKAGYGIEAGEGIKAGYGIEAGSFINCKLSLNVAYRIFAGLALWKKEISDEEKTITCGKLEKGKVEYGILKEIGISDDKKEVSLSGKEIKVTFDGTEYTDIIK